MIALALAALLALAASPAEGAVVVLSRHTGEVLLERGDVRAAVPVGRLLEPSGERWTPALRALGVREGRASPLAVARASRLLAEAGAVAGVTARSEGPGWEVRVERDLVAVATSRGDLRPPHPAGETFTPGPLSPGGGEGISLDPAPSLPAATAPSPTTPRPAAPVPSAPASPPSGPVTPSPVAAALSSVRAPAREAARVQVFGLLPPGSVRGRCARGGFAVGPGGPVALSGEVVLDGAARRGALVCAGPWWVRVPGARRPRAYAGVFTREPVQAPAEAVAGATPREARARRGSDLVFRTDRLAYAAGVVAAEDAASRGATREALALVADANARAERHPGRPPCDTTHCQAFLGTAAPHAEERAALARPLEAGAWRPFSRGGLERWSEPRHRAEVERALGPGARDLAFARGRVRWTDDTGPREAGCEVLRGPLALPACPEAAASRGSDQVFTGRGRGHGEGLDLEAAKASGLSADALLERAYGAERARR